MGGSFGKGNQEQWWNDQFPDWALPLGTPERFRSFMNLIDGYFRKKGLKVEITPDGVRTSEPESVFGYDNLLQSCVGLDVVAMKQQVTGHFDSLMRGLLDSDALALQLHDWNFAKDRLRIRLWDETHFHKQVQGVVRKDVPGLLSVLSIDTPDSIMTAGDDLPKRWNVEIDELFRIALANSLAEFNPDRHLFQSERPDGPFALEDQSLCFASLVLDPAKLQELCGKHGAFIALPIRNTILVAPFVTLADMSDLNVIYGLCVGIHKQGPGSLSERVWWVKDGRWIEIDISMHEKRIVVRPPEEFVEYLNQIAAMEQDGQA